MTAFFVARIKVRNPEKMQAYSAAARPTFAAYGGSLVLRGTSEMTLVGNDDGPHMTAIFQFPDLSALNAWFNSPEYQQTIALRDEIGEVQFVAYEVPAA